MGVDHQVPGGQVRVGLELLLIAVPPGPGLFGPAGQGRGQLPLRQHRQPPLRIFAPGGQGSHGNEHRALFRGLFPGQVHGGGDFPVRQHPAEVPGPDLAAAQHHHPVTRREIVGQVRAGQLQGAAVAGQLLGRQLEKVPGLQQLPPGGETVQLHHRMLFQPQGQLRLRGGKIRQLTGQKARLHSGGHVLLQLPQPAPQGLRCAAAVLHADQSIRGQIVQGGGLFRVHRRHAAVRAVGGDPLAQQGGIGGQQVPQGLGALPPGKALYCGLQPGGGVLRRMLLPAGQYLRRRKQQRLPAVFHPALGGGVKYAQGVDLVVEKFAAHRLLHARGEHVQDAAPQGKLSRALHLVAAGISGSGQPPGQGVQIPLLAHGQGQCRPLQNPGRDAPLHQRVRGSDHHGAVRRWFSHWRLDSIGRH